MHQQHHVEKVRQAVARILMAVGRSAPRRLCVVVTLALVIGSVGQTPLAQAAPARVPVQPYMDIVSPKTTVCVGKTVRYEARVYTPPTTVVGIKIDRYALDGITVEAFSQDKNVGDFLNTREGSATQITGSTTGEVVSLTNPEEEPVPHTATFSFKAKKAGRTTLYFIGIAHGAYVHFEVPVRVINCKYKLTLLSKWKVGMTSVAVSTDGVLTADENGYFTGSANIKWVTSMICGIRSPIAPSKADLTGTLNESDQLVVKMTFGPISSAGGGPCSPYGGAITSNFATLAPLRIEGPATRAISTRQAQPIKAINGSFTGTANVIVIPVDGTQ